MVRASVALLRQGRPAFSAAGSSLEETECKPFVAPTREARAAAASKMFEVCWGPALSAFSHALERLFYGERPTALALEGLKLSACLASVLQLETARDALVNALASFTTLHARRGSRQLAPRNANAIEALLSLAAHEACADALSEAWLPLLQVRSRRVDSKRTFLYRNVSLPERFFPGTQVASRVQHLRLLAQGLRTDDAFFGEGGGVATGGLSSEDEHETAAANALVSMTSITDEALDDVQRQERFAIFAGVLSLVADWCRGE